VKTQLYIPRKLNIGFQNRSDTFSKKLAYIIYYDDKKVLRKQRSWEGWRDKKIPNVEIDNEPYDGFVLNKGILRDGYWGNGHNMVRIFDGRAGGFEFEITVANLLFVLMTTNCHKRGLEGNFVYSWDRDKLVLLPEGCEEYQNSTKFSDLQAGKILVKDLILGATYENKSQEIFTYLGREKVYYYNRKDFGLSSYRRKEKEDVEAKKKEYSETIAKGYNPVSFKNEFIFADESGNIVSFKSLEKFSKRLTDTAISNYAELVEKFAKSDCGAPPTGLFLKSFKFTKPKYSYYGNYYARDNGDNSYTVYSITERTQGGYTGINGAYEARNFYELQDQYVLSFENEKLLVKPLLSYKSKGYSYYNYYDTFEFNQPKTQLTKEQLEGLELKKLFVKTSKGNFNLGKLLFNEYE
jgi:hypothetical protein